MQLFVNNYRVTLTAPVLAAATNIPVSSTAGLPALAASDFFTVTLTQPNGLETSWEVVQVTGYDAVSLTVVRSYEGAASDWPSGSVASARLTAKGMDGKLSLSGGTMTGQLNVLNAVAATEAVPLGQADGRYNALAAAYVRPNLCPDVDQWTLYAGGGAILTSSVWGKIAQWGALTNGGQGVATSPSMPCVAGATYVVTGDSLLFATAGDCYFDLQFYDSTGTLLLDGPQSGKAATYDFAVDNTNRDATAVQVAAPANAVTMQARYCVDATNAVTACGFRQVKVERGTLPATAYTQEADVSAKLNLSGGTMTGALALAADPVNVLEAATKQYVDARPAPFLRLPKFAGNNMFVAGQMNSTTPTTMTPAINVIYLIPFCAPFDMTISTIGVDVTTAGSANYLLGVYSADDDTFNLNTLRASGIVNPVTTGSRVLSAVGYALKAGRFYLAAFQSSAASGQTRAIAAAALFPLFGKFYTQAYFYTHATLTQTYNGTLPATIGYASMVLAQAATVPMIHFGW